MKIIAISLTIIALFTACSSTHVGARSDGKHHGVDVKTKILKF